MAARAPPPLRAPHARLASALASPTLGTRAGPTEVELGSLSIWHLLIVLVVFGTMGTIGVSLLVFVIRLAQPKPSASLQREVEQLRAERDALRRELDSRQ